VTADDSKEENSVREVGNCVNTNTELHNKLQS